MMNGRMLTVLTTLAGVLAVGEFASAMQIGLGKDPGGAGFAVVFGAMTGRIPTLHTIAEHHHVSHRVAARALEILKGEGMIIDVPGEGEFVRHPRT